LSRLPRDALLGASIVTETFDLQPAGKIALSVQLVRPYDYPFQPFTRGVAGADDILFYIRFLSTTVTGRQVGFQVFKNELEMGRTTVLPSDFEVNVPDLANSVVTIAVYDGDLANVISSPPSCR
jgi:hypothetical protein